MAAKNPAISISCFFVNRCGIQIGSSFMKPACSYWAAFLSKNSLSPLSIVLHQLFVLIAFDEGVSFFVDMIILNPAFVYQRNQIGTSCFFGNTVYRTQFTNSNNFFGIFFQPLYYGGLTFIITRQLDGSTFRLFFSYALCKTLQLTQAHLTLMNIKMDKISNIVSIGLRLYTRFMILGAQLGYYIRR